MAQRKFLRQVSTYVKNTDPYPRLFVADLNYDPSSVEEEVCNQVIILCFIYLTLKCIRLMGILSHFGCGCKWGSRLE